MTYTIQDIDYMKLALQLAQKGEYTVSPNPMVGCVIVKNNQIVGEGFHEKFGEAHAEINALKQAKNLAKNATAYITLEPCCHHGKTPPCTKALIQSGIKKIFIACLDPYPLVSGKGVHELINASIDVHVGLCETEAKNLNHIFFYYMEHKKPFIIAKWAMSLDGKTITHKNDSREISGEEALHETHLLRAKVDAVLIGAHTAIKDNPQLTCRIPDVNYNQPVRIILANSQNLPLHLNIFNSEAKTIIVKSMDRPSKNPPENYPASVTELVIKQEASGKINLHHLLEELGKMNISSVLVEGGMATHQTFIKAKLINMLRVYLSPVIIGDLEKKQSLGHLKMKKLGKDFCFTSDIR